MAAEGLLVLLGVAGVVLSGLILQRRRRRELVASRLRPGPATHPLGLTGQGLRLGVAMGAGALVGGGPLAVVAGGLLVLAGPAARAVRQGGRADRYDADVVAFLVAFARSLRSGAVAHVALAESAAVASGDLAGDLALLGTRLEGGSTLVDGLRRWAEERPRPAVRSTAAALALGHEMGGLRAEIVDSVAGAVRQRLDARAEARGLATQARASAVVLAAGPILFLVVGLLRRSAAAQFLLGSPAGLICLVGGLLLDAVGLLAMLRLVAGVGR